MWGDGMGWEVGNWRKILIVPDVKFVKGVGEEYK